MKRKKGREREKNGKIERNICGKRKEKEEYKRKMEAQFGVHLNIGIPLLLDLSDISSMKRPQ